MNQGNNELAEVNRFSNLDLEVSVELGRKELTLQEARSLKKDECIELDKLAGEAMEVLGVALFLRRPSLGCGLLEVPVPESIPSFRLNVDS